MHSLLKKASPVKCADYECRKKLLRSTFAQSVDELVARCKKDTLSTVQTGQTM